MIELTPENLAYLAGSVITVIAGVMIASTMYDRAGKSIARDTVKAYLVKHAAMLGIGAVAILGGAGLMTDWLSLMLVSVLYYIDIRCSKYKWADGQAQDSKRPDPNEGQSASVEQFAALNQRVPHAPDSQQ